MANCEQCGYTLECHAGCGIFCRNDCTDCILWCEPHDHVMVMRREEQGDGARTCRLPRDWIELLVPQDIRKTKSFACASTSYPEGCWLDS
jgi:hypothetical protein